MRVSIHNQDTLPEFGQVGSKINSSGGLTNPALLVDECMHATHYNTSTRQD